MFRKKGGDTMLTPIFGLLGLIFYIFFEFYLIDKENEESE